MKLNSSNREEQDKKFLEYQQFMRKENISFLQKLNKLWKGEYPLVRSYWFYFVCGNIAFGGVLGGVKHFNNVPLTLLIVLLASIYFTISATGTIRAAILYKGNFVWKVLAIFNVILSLFLILLGTLGRMAS